MQLNKAQRSHLFLVIIGYLTLAIVYALSTPPLEASDEYKHYPVVQYIENELALPVLDPEEPGLWLQSAAQPPLYYAIMAAITGGVDTSDLAEIHQINPHAYVGNPNQIYNKNLIIHQPAREQFPWQGAILAIYLARFATILFGVVTIIIVSRLGVLLFNQQVAILAAAVTAFNPMFIFVNASVNNDGLAILLGSLGLYMIVTLWREEPLADRHWIRFFLTGLVLGLAILTKLSLVGLLLLAGLALAVLSWRRKEWKTLFLGGGIILLTSLLVASPWLLYNLKTYGDPTALNVFLKVQEQRPTPPSLSDWIGELGTLYRSFWGLFGGVNIAAPELFYNIYNLIFLAGVAGVGFWLIYQRRGRQLPFSERIFDRSADAKITDLPKGLWLLAIWIVILCVLLVRWNYFSRSFQGRLLFPALGAINILWATGLITWLPAKWHSRLTGILAITFLIMAGLLPWMVIRPAYAYPEPLGDVPVEEQFGPITFDTGNGQIQLVGVEVTENQSVRAGEGAVEVDLYWRAVEPVDKDFLSVVHLLGRDYTSVGSVNRYPAWGMIPTSQWQPGEIWRDTYHVYVGATAQSPNKLLIKAGLYDPETKKDLVAYGPDGNPIDLLLIGEARLAGDQGENEEPETSLDVPMDGGITFLGYDSDPRVVRPGDPLTLTLYWLANEKPSRDWTVFVQLVDSNGVQVAGADSLPLNGNYPTAFWEAGEVVADEHVLHVPVESPPGEYHIVIGLYDPTSLVRLARLDGSGDSIRWTITVGGDV